MKKKYFLYLSIFLLNIIVNGQVFFVANQGQWENEFTHLVRLNNGAIFFEETGPTYHLVSAEDMEENFGHGEHAKHSHGNSITRHHAFKQKWLNAQKPVIIGQEKETFYHNYFLGNNPQKWKGNVPVFRQLDYRQVYPNINIKYYQSGEQLKYDWIVLPGGNYKQIQWEYPGADSSWIENGKIVIQTSIGKIFEELPSVYVKRGAITVQKQAEFIQSKGVFGFDIEPISGVDTLVIDPTVVFGSFSGSTSDNWGYTATYDHLGNLFGGGVVFSTGYPLTLGAFQMNHGNPTGSGFNSPLGCDIGLTKFNPQGTGLLFSTYIGGSANEQPHSMFADANGNLFVFGVTSSLNFPVVSGAFQQSFGGGNNVNVNSIDFVHGTDIYILKISSGGNSMLASTYLGGSGNDGLNLDAQIANYGDQARGEIVIGDDGFVYIASSTLSSNFPTVNPSQSTNSGLHDAVIVKINSTLSSVSWSTYFGTTFNDMGYSLKYAPNGLVYVCGGTKGAGLPATANRFHPNYMGGASDGFIAALNSATGQTQFCTYIGTNGLDQTFLIDVDKYSNPIVLGQTSSPAYPITQGTFSNPGAKQFLHKLTPDLTSTLFSTVFGKAGGPADFVPIALNIDECQNIMLSGWGGVANTGFPAGGGNLVNMPITNDAFQKTTDGSDLYFAVFGANASSLKYATYFGGPLSKEHVDGGTSRFDPSGTIYQAVCAGCGGNSDFPSLPGAWSSTNNSMNCNLGVVKINFETSIKAIAVIDSTTLDTNCNRLTFSLKNKSRNAHVYTWNVSNGFTSRAFNPALTLTGLGTYKIKLLVTDTLCNISDSTELIINFTKGKYPEADFEMSYSSCDVFRNVQFTNKSLRANKYFWNFGDGQFSNVNQPSHAYSAQGTYTVVLIATDTTCGVSDTLSKVINFSNNIPAPAVLIKPDSCFFGGIQVTYANDSAWYTYEWNFEGTIDRNKYPEYRYRRSGTYNFSLTIKDTVCNTLYTFNFTEDVERIEDRIFIPNAFTPNRDGKNEYFYIAGNNCLTDTRFVILNSFGEVVFETNRPFSEFWDGYIEGKPAQQDVYVYVFTSLEYTKYGYITVFY